MKIEAERNPFKFSKEEVVKWLEGCRCVNTLGEFVEPLGLEEILEFINCPVFGIEAWKTTRLKKQIKAS